MKHTFFTLVVCFAALTITAQEAITFNPKGGINIATQGDQDDITSSAQTGWNVGLDLRFGEGVVFFQPGVFFYQYNTDYRVLNLAGATGQLETSIKVQSFKLPAQLGFRIIPTDVFELRGNLGPAFNFPVSASSDDGGFEVDRKDYKPVSVGGVLGLGVDIAFLTFDVNYEFGISDYVEFQDSNVKSSPSRQNILSLALGFKF